jgi:hypothetical protein
VRTSTEKVRFEFSQLHCELYSIYIRFVTPIAHRAYILALMTVARHRARWREDVVTRVVEIPVWDDDIKPTLFYNKMDYRDFQEAEQRRYDKMMAKQIQKMVYAKMGPQLQEAMDRGASAEELEAMMPQTTEAIFALLGTIPKPGMPAQLTANINETTHKGSSEEPHNEHLVGELQQIPA